MTAWNEPDADPLGDMTRVGEASRQRWLQGAQPDTDHDTAVLTEGELYVHARIDNLLTVADRFDRPGGSRALARRARDKAAGMEVALAHLTVQPPRSTSADAWDEGYMRGVLDQESELERADNPYRGALVEPAPGSAS